MSICKSTKLYLIDPRQRIAVRLPNDGCCTFVTDAALWRPGEYYLPPGAKIMSAVSETDAIRKVDKLMECAYVDVQTVLF